jgi:hypothetical protein
MKANDAIKMILLIILPNHFLLIIIIEREDKYTNRFSFFENKRQDLAIKVLQTHQTAFSNF